MASQPSVAASRQPHYAFHWHEHDCAMLLWPRAGALDSALRPSLSVQLDPDWRMELSYAMRAVDEPGNQAVSNAVTLGFSRGFELAR